MIRIPALRRALGLTAALALCGASACPATPRKAHAPSPSPGATPPVAADHRPASDARTAQPTSRRTLRPGEVARIPSHFGTVVVFDDGAYRCLAFNNRQVVQSCRSRTRPLDFRYEYVSLMLAAALIRLDSGLSALLYRGRPRPARRAVVLGLGGAALPTLLARHFPNLRVDTVEIDPAVVQAAERWFGYRTRPGESLYLQDAARFAERPDRRGRYDLVLVDCYGATFIPEALQRRRFLAALGRLLAPGGVIVANLWQTHPRYAQLVRRYASLYPAVWVLPGRSSGNAMVVATPVRAHLRPDRIARRAREIVRRRRIALDLAGHLRRLRPAPRAR